MKSLSKSDAVEIVLEITYIMNCINDGNYDFSIGRLNCLRDDIHYSFRLKKEDYLSNPYIKEAK